MSTLGSITVLAPNCCVMARRAAIGPGMIGKVPLLRAPWMAQAERSAAHDADELLASKVEADEALRNELTPQEQRTWETALPGPSGGIRWV